MVLGLIFIFLISLIAQLHLRKLINKHWFELNLVSQLSDILKEEKRNINILKNQIKKENIRNFLISSSIGPLHSISQNGFNISELTIESIPIFKIISSTYKYNTDPQIVMIRNINYELENKIEKLKPLENIKNFAGIYTSISLIGLLIIYYKIDFWWLIFIIILSLKLLYENFKIIDEVLEDEDIQALKKIIEDDFF